MDNNTKNQSKDLNMNALKDKNIDEYFDIKQQEAALAQAKAKPEKLKEQGMLALPEAFGMACAKCGVDERTATKVYNKTNEFLAMLTGYQLDGTPEVNMYKDPNNSHKFDAYIRKGYDVAFRNNQVIDELETKIDSTKEKMVAKYGDDVTTDPAKARSRFDNIPDAPVCENEGYDGDFTL